MISDKDLYWLSGLLEGEGSFMINRRTETNKTFRIMVVTTDRDVIARAARIMKTVVNRHNGNQKRWGRKPAYSSQVVNRKAIGWMMTLYSLMGERRKAKIKDIIIEWRNYSNREQKAFGDTTPKKFKGSTAMRKRSILHHLSKSSKLDSIFVNPFTKS